MSDIFPQPLGVIENVNRIRRIPMGRIGEIKVVITPLTWLNPPLFFALGLALTFLRPGLDWPGRLRLALVAMLALEVLNIVHSLGHIISGRLAGAPMDELLVTATRHITLYYGEQSGYPRRVHLMRALGGPLANLLVGGLCLLLVGLFDLGLAQDFVSMLGTISLVVGTGALFPAPSVDGEVIWRLLLGKHS